MNIEEIAKIENLYQLIAYLLISFFTIGLPVLMKNKNIIKKRLDIDEIQTKIITEIQVSLSEVKELVKNMIFINQLETKINANMMKILNIREFKNKILTDAIRFGASQLVDVSKIIFNSNFRIENVELKEIILYHLRKVKYTISGNSNILPHFIQQTQYRLKTEVEMFLIQYNNFKNKQNGERNKAFENAILLLLENCINIIIDEQKRVIQ